MIQFSTSQFRGSHWHVSRCFYEFSGKSFKKSVFAPTGAQLMQMSVCPSSPNLSKALRSLQSLLAYFIGWSVPKMLSLVVICPPDVHVAHNNGWKYEVDKCSCNWHVQTTNCLLIKWNAAPARLCQFLPIVLEKIDLYKIPKENTKYSNT